MLIRSGPPRSGAWAIISGLLQEAEAFGQVMFEPQRKAVFASNAYALSSRDIQGKARRGS